MQLLMSSPRVASWLGKHDYSRELGIRVCAIDAALATSHEPESILQALSSTRRGDLNLVQALESNHLTKVLQTGLL